MSAARWNAILNYGILAISILAYVIPVAVELDSLVASSPRWPQQQATKSYDYSLT